MTENKRRILEALSRADDYTCLEVGAPPRSAATIAALLEADMRTTARTLRQMEQQGLVVAEVRPVDVWADLKQRSGHHPRNLKCYWNAGQIDTDKAAAEQWKAGAHDRQEAAWLKLDAFLFDK